VCEKSSPRKRSSIKFIISDTSGHGIQRGVPTRIWRLLLSHDPVDSARRFPDAVRTRRQLLHDYSNLDLCEESSEVEVDRASTKCAALRPNTRTDRRTYTDSPIGRRGSAAINFVLKSRASRYVAASDESHLYPERTITPSLEQLDMCFVRLAISCGTSAARSMSAIRTAQAITRMPMADVPFSQLPKKGVAKDLTRTERSLRLREWT